MPNYKGTICKVSETKRHGWISRKSITDLEDRLIILDTTKDLFLHLDDYGQPLVVGQVVVFNVEEDPTRLMAYRAVNVSNFVTPISAIDIHFDSKVVDNPSVPMRWCFRPEMLRRIRDGLSKGYGYAVLLVVRHDDDPQGYHEFRELKDPLRPFSFVTFSKPGMWRVGLILFERTLIIPGKNTSRSLEFVLNEKLLSLDGLVGSRMTYPRHLPDLDLQGSKALWNIRTSSHISMYDSDKVKPIASNEVSVEVPQDIFAMPPSPAVKAFANYWYRGRLYDECDFRRRLILMCLCGWFPWLGWEMLKRLGQFSVGMLLLLFCIRGAFTTIGEAFQPRIKFSISFDVPEDENGRSKYYKPFSGKYAQCLTPGMFIIYAVLLGFVLVILKIFYIVLCNLVNFARHPGLIQAVEHGFAYAVLICMLAVLWICRRLWKNRRKPSLLEMEAKRLRKEEALEHMKLTKTLEIAKRQALLAASQESALVCGDAPQVVSLQAMPPELRTWSMQLSAFKRKVCRPFA